MKRNRFVLVVCALTAAACRKAPVAASAPAAPIAPGALQQERLFLDLEPGWRLTTVTPLMQETPASPWKYGRVKGVASTANGLNVTLQLTADQRFGFETARFSVMPTGLRFADAVRNLEGQPSASNAPVLRLFPADKKKQFVRVLFLTRVSDVEYNTALISAGSQAELETFTRIVRSEPERACREEKRRWCVWVPPAVAVRAERPIAGKPGEYQPAI